MSCEACVDDNSVGPLFSFEDFRTLVDPCIWCLNLINIMDLEFADRYRLASEVSLIYIDITTTNNTVSCDFSLLFWYIGITRHQLFAVNYLLFTLPYYANLHSPLSDFLNLLITDIEHDIVDGSRHEWEK